MTVLFVVATILFFLTLDWLVRRVRGTQRVRTAPAPQPLHYPIRVPDGIFFARSHTWLNLLPSGKLRLGIDDFIARMIDTPEISLLKRSGETVNRGDPLFALAAQGHRLVVRSPIDGEILGVNERLAADPAAQKEFLFSDGWGYVIRPKQISQLKDLLLGTESKAWIRGEFRRMGDFLAGIGRKEGLEPLLMQDGGLPVAGILQRMDDADWKEFEHEFLEIK